MSSETSPLRDAPLSEQGDLEALSQAAETLAEAARELAQYASYAEIVGGISTNRVSIRKWCDKTFAALNAYDDALASAPAVPAPPTGTSESPWSFDMEAAPRDGTKVDLMFPHPRGRKINCFYENSPLTGRPMWLWLTPKWQDGTLLPEDEWDTNAYPNMQPYAWRLAEEPGPPSRPHTKGGEA